MTLKEFFKPNIPKIILLLVLITATYLIPVYDTICISASNCQEIKVDGLGYPKFYGYEFDGDDSGRFNFNKFNFFINLICYYVLSISIIFLMSKILEKNK